MIPAFRPFLRFVPRLLVRSSPGVGWIFTLSLLGCAHSPQPITPPPSAHTLVETVAIHAPPSQVYAAITDFPSYSQWNPWLREAWGVPQVGEAVWARVWLGGTPRRARHVVVEVDPPGRFCWRDAGWTTAFAKAKRCRTLTPDGLGGTHLRQELSVWGPFAGEAMRRYGSAMAEGLAAETRALKTWLEPSTSAAGEGLPLSFPAVVDDPLPDGER